jgi:hypothetical protein
MLADELGAILELSLTSAQDSASARDDPLSRGGAPKAATVPDTRGTDLCSELSTVPTGKPGWVRYEAICIEIIKYLFPEDLEGLRKQTRTTDDLNRFDFICRVRSNTEFWRFLIDHLNSRYMIFEFKNYDEPIGQGQVLTTEKYLLERAFRRTAIMFTRKGSSDSARAMAQGAMREHGKLILILNDKDICGMLHMREKGNDPTDLLFQLTDDFLMSLPR